MNIQLNRLKPYFSMGVGVLLMISPLAQSAQPLYADGVLTLPRVMVQGLGTYNNVKVKIDLGTGTASLQEAENEHIIELRTLLSSTESVPASHSTGSAGSPMQVDSLTGAISGMVRLGGLTEVQAVTIHQGSMGETGAVIIELQQDLDFPRYIVPMGSVLTEMQLQALNEGNLYINVQTTQNASAVRGQMDVSVFERMMRPPNLSVITETTQDLSSNEITMLQFMHEEEKVARDIYLSLYLTWGTQVFLNISGSEQSHMDSLGALVEQYGVENKLLEEQGLFTNPELQTLYDDLSTQGQQSLVEALIVGALVEEVDIRDLEMAIASTDNVALIRVYESLLHGSHNHLRAFVKNLTNNGIDNYTAQVLEQSAVDTILSETNTHMNTM